MVLYDEIIDGPLASDGGHHVVTRVEDTVFDNFHGDSGISYNEWRKSLIYGYITEDGSGRTIWKKVPEENIIPTSF